MKTPPVDYAALEPDDHYLADLGRGIWLMDNHRWALLVWERHRRGRRFDLVHVDHHFDACDDFSADATTAEAVCNATLEQIARILEEGKLVRFDSFIAPAVARKLVGTVHFYCTESDHDVELGLYQPLVDRAEASQVIHESVESRQRRASNGPSCLIYVLTCSIDPTTGAKATCGPKRRSPSSCAL
ncbi:MAG: UPF0489 family protein [Burkholderiaceae bacterium]|nr:UPF0489 family protein [Burkholderiaceae bacterium]